MANRYPELEHAIVSREGSLLLVEGAKPEAHHTSTESTNSGIIEGRSTSPSYPVQDHQDSLFNKIVTESALLKEGLFHGAIENPVNGASQFVNHISAGVAQLLENDAFSLHIPELHLVDENKVHSSIAGEIGDFAGEFVDLVAVATATSGIMARSFKFEITPLRYAIGAGIDKGLFKPTDENAKDFYESRAEAGAWAMLHGFVIFQGVRTIQKLLQPVQ